MVEHNGELTLCPFRVDGADFAFCYKDDKCPCYRKEESNIGVDEWCYRDNIAYHFYSSKNK